MLQFALIATILGLGLLAPGWPDGARWWLKGAGVLVLFCGALVIAKAGRALGSGFTPFPKPAEGGSLVEDGPYAVVRHPIVVARRSLRGGADPSSAPPLQGDRSSSNSSRPMRLRGGVDYCRQRSDLVAPGAHGPQRAPGPPTCP